MQAIRNVQDGINMLRTADGAFSTITSMLQRMRELSVQAANGTYDLNDRVAIQNELDSLKEQIDQTAYFTTFNGQQLLTSQTKTYNPGQLNYQYDGTSAALGGWSDPMAADLHVPTAGSSYMGVTYDEIQSLKAVLPSLLNGALAKAQGMLINSGIDESNLVTIGAPPAAGLPFQVSFVIDPGSPSYTLSNADYLAINLYPFLGSGPQPNISLEQAITQGMAQALVQREDKFKSSLDTAGPNTGDYDAWLSLGSTTTGAYNALRGIVFQGAADTYVGFGLETPGTFTFDTPTADFGRSSAATFARYLVENYGTNALEGLISTIVHDGSGNRATIATDVGTYLQNLTGQTKAGMEAAVNTWLTTKVATTPSPAAWNHNAIGNTESTTAETLSSTPVEFQVGADFGDVLDVNFSAGALGNLDFVGLVNVRDQQSAAASITTLDRALAIVSDARGKLGASENRLGYTLDRLQGYAEDAQASVSRMRDTDMADESTNLTRSQILSQASIGSLHTFYTIEQDQVGTLLDGLSLMGDSSSTTSSAA